AARAGGAGDDGPAGAAERPPAWRPSDTRISPASGAPHTCDRWAPTRSRWIASGAGGSRPTASSRSSTSGPAPCRKRYRSRPAARRWRCRWSPARRHASNSSSRRGAPSRATPPRDERRDRVAARGRQPRAGPPELHAEAYTKTSVPAFKIAGDFLAYASPDSTYAVTRRLMDSANSEIIIGIYDFSADYMKDLVLHTMKRGVTVYLMLDIDSKDEQALFDELKKFGCKAVPAPSCAAKTNRYFPSSHEKVIVIDRLWTLVQSGNYSANSIPFNATDGGDPQHFVTGNRDMGVAIRSRPLAAFFARILRADMELELGGGAIEAADAPPTPAHPDLVEAMPKNIPAELFPSKRFTSSAAISVAPVLSPDNYMKRVPDFLRSAKKSILIEQQYIRSEHPEVVILLDAIKAARQKNPALDVRIVLGKLFAAKDVPKEKKNLDTLRTTYGLRLGQHIRYIDVNRFVHCHNKLVIVDGTAVLVSSPNWSRT